MRYVVLDTGDDYRAIRLGECCGTLLAEFHTEESATALVRQRLAHGDRGVVAVDSLTGEVVFPREPSQPSERGPRVSGMRPRVSAAEPAGQPPARAVSPGKRR